MQALKAVDLSVAEGEVFALLGPNGAGKTSLVKILCSLVLPNGGRARVAGYDVVMKQEHSRRCLSLVLGEERSFYWRLTGRENLEFFGALYGLSQEVTAARIVLAADTLGLNRLDVRYQEYSTGTKQRLALARSFLNDSRVVFMDEPTRSLDPEAAGLLRRAIKDFASRDGRTVFFTTHNTLEAEALADRIGILVGGRLKACGTLEELREAAGLPGASLEDIFLKTVREP